MVEGAANEHLIPSCPAHLWRIHGKDYDLSSFVKAHPGGAIAIELGKGVDCTNLFESYHVMNELHRYKLQKFEVAVAHAYDGHLEVSAESAFHADIKAMLRKHFGGCSAGTAHKAKLGHSLLMTLIVILTLLTWIGWMRGSYLALFGLPFLAWLLMVNIAHDSSHFAVSRIPVVNQLGVYFSSPLYYTDATWYMQHLSSHHLYTNDLKHDVDLHHGAARWHPEKPHAKDYYGRKNLAWHAFAFVVSTILLAIVQPFFKFLLPALGFELPKGWWSHYISSSVMDRVIEQRTAAGIATTSRLAVNALLWGWAVAVLAFPVWTNGFTFKAALFSLYPYVTSSILFMVVTQVSHIQPETQTKQVIEEVDFFKKQATTSLDYSCASEVWSFLTGGLNTQSLHHVAPSVHSSHYTDLYPQFYDVCVRHGCAPAQAANVLGALRTHLAYVYNLGEGYSLPSMEM